MQATCRVFPSDTFEALLEKVGYILLINTFIPTSLLFASFLIRLDIHDCPRLHHTDKIRDGVNAVKQTWGELIIYRIRSLSALLCHEVGVCTTVVVLSFKGHFKKPSLKAIQTTARLKTSYDMKTLGKWFNDVYNKRDLYSYSKDYLYILKKIQQTKCI